MDFCQYLYEKGKIEKEDLEELKNEQEKLGKILLHQHKLSQKQLAAVFSQYLREIEKK